MKIVIDVPEEAYKEIHSLKYLIHGLKSEENRQLFYQLINAIQDGTPLPEHHTNKVIEKIKAEILEEAEYAYADFDEYKENILHAESDELPDDDFRYGLERAIEIINKYKAENDKECDSK